MRGCVTWVCHTFTTFFAIITAGRARGALSSKASVSIKQARVMTVRSAILQSGMAPARRSRGVSWCFRGKGGEGGQVDVRPASVEFIRAHY